MKLPLCKAAFFMAVTAISSFPSSSSATDICTSLSNIEDQQACEATIRSRPWLTSVQKLTTDTSITDNYFSTTGTLYIFDSLDGNDSQISYSLPSTVIMADNSALIGNGGKTQRPRLELSPSDDGSQFAITGAANYLLADLELSTTSSESDHTQVFVDGVDSLQILGVSFSSNFTPNSTSSNILNLLQITNSTGNTPQSNIEIDHCSFQIPDIPPGEHFNSLTALALPALDNQKQVNLKFSNNHIITSDYCSQTGNTFGIAFDFSGNINLLDGSVCNQVTDSQGSDLLGHSHDKLLEAFRISSEQSQAIGFTNGFGWGWKQVNKLPLVTFDSWTAWNSAGVDIACNSVPPNNSGHSNIALAVSLAVPLTSAVFVVSAVSLLVMWPYIEVRWFRSYGTEN